MKTLALLRVGATAGILGASALGASRPMSASAQGASQATIAAPHAEHSVLVGFVPGTPAAERANARRTAGTVDSEPLSPLAADAEKLQLGPGVTVEQAIANLLRNPNVRYAEPDYLLQFQDVSNDPYYTGGLLWGMYGDATSPQNPYGSGAGEAWAVGNTGSRSIYVGVIDEGIQYTHPDLDANVWTNPFDPVDGIDNDGNGKVDDVHGWDFFHNDNSVYDGRTDDHGTHVAGTIGAEGGNGIGVAGVNWQVTLISAKFLGPNGGYTSDAVKALDYLTDLKTRHNLDIVATNNSWGGGGFSQSLLDAINRGGDAGILFVAAAGNSGTNNDTTAFYPANYQCVTRYDTKGSRGWDCVIAVAAITSSGARASFSDYGATTVDIGAPGSGIYSTVPTNSYASYSGTSMATPHVSGAVALCASINSSLTAQQLRDAVLSSAAPTASLAGITVTGGRLDIGAMATQCGPGGSGDSPPVADGQSVTTDEDTPATVTLTGSDPDGNLISFNVTALPSYGSLYDGTGIGGVLIAGNKLPYTVTDTAHNVTYQPRAGYTGTDSFDFNVSDGQATSPDATVSIAVSAPVTASFSVSASPGTRNVKAGGSTTYTVTLSTSGGYSDSVGLVVSDLPANATATFSPPDLLPPTASSTLTVTTSNKTPKGTYALTITGTGGDGTTHETSVSLRVR
jgi:subtilisin family serine protease